MGPTLAAGFPEDPDMNNPDSTGTGPVPMNNPGGIRTSPAIAYLNPNRHRLNLTVKANVLAHRVLFDGDKAVGVEVERGLRDVYSGRRRDYSLCWGYSIASVTSSIRGRAVKSSS
ncbi:MAG: hypothetical protein Ct9H300mP11_00890 [Chloroflexota bacterium]|nr:MAG: hypothetical protein Ct9H300mP11_00890 [Chloroflexota bacterium]